MLWPARGRPACPRSLVATLTLTHFSFLVPDRQCLWSLKRYATLSFSSLLLYFIWNKQGGRFFLKASQGLES